MGRKKRLDNTEGNGVIKKDFTRSRVIQDCLDCYSACISSFHYVLEKRPSKVRQFHLILFLDTAAACKIAADFVLRSSRYQAEYVRLCMMLSEECHTSCSRFVDDDKMRICAKISKMCAVSCRKFINKSL